MPQGKPNIGSTPTLLSGVNADIAAVHPGNQLGCCQPEPGAFVFRSVEPSERQKNGIAIFRIDADSIVRNRDTPEIAGSAERDPNVRRLIRPAKLYGVADQDFENRRHMSGVSRYHRQRIRYDNG